eukprot:XP_011603330.1 PREDICTED: haloacid dehalogenase-like hydrolase domain-containing protein 2 [Takifugu rubripes]
MVDLSDGRRRLFRRSKAPFPEREGAGFHLSLLQTSCCQLVSIMASRRALKAVLIDLSGTLHVEDTAVPGAQEALRRLRQASVAVKFVTNTTKECKRDLVERLRRLDFDVQEREIFSSLSAARSLLEQEQQRPLLLLEESALEDFSGVDTSEPNAISNLVPELRV